MECNKDEAIRAKEIAEKKLAEKDISGAKRFASKAQDLFPGLEGLSQFQEVLDVFTAVESKVNGEVDWYKVLGVDRFADDETLRKKYRKLALAVHPDKNKSAGAEGAFKIISQAWTLLSDKVKKAVYDQKLNVRATHNKFTGVNPSVHGRYNFSSSSTATRKPSGPSYPSTASTPSKSNGGTKFTCSPTAARYSSASSNPQPNTTPNMSNGSTRFSSSSTTANNSSNPTKPQTDSTPRKTNSNTFWTLCKRCMMRYEYVTLYLNKNLVCPKCRLPFLATMVPPPPPKRNTSRNIYRKQNGVNPASNTSSDLKVETTRISESRDSVPQNSFFNSGGSNMSTPAMDAAQTVRDMATRDRRKRGREEPFRATVNLETVGKKSNATTKTDGTSTNNVSIFGKGAKSAKKTCK
ncbi:OLC1v1013657C1 [Oldenlandia corymbosa var. corymbosa]|uniref:OLC1v1013657C1 n=1 Tax=Oldenlandia corymbosa var. corymbosa TaxID=529605 RepID=A0AAV1DYY0_OLDCO|nr:OLC1v1013657C1 [Oldenlandia corymbosa var. corymbosa]